MLHRRRSAATVTVLPSPRGAYGGTSQPSMLGGRCSSGGTTRITWQPFVGPELAVVGVGVGVHEVAGVRGAGRT